MAVALEQFVQQLEDSGILAGDTLQGFIPPKAAPKDAEDLLRELLRQLRIPIGSADLQMWPGMQPETFLFPTAIRIRES